MKTSVIRIIILLIVARAVLAPAQNLLTNGSFEVPGPPDGTYVVVGSGSTFIPGWTALGSAGVEYLVPKNYYNFGVAQDGNCVVDLSFGMNGELSQSFAATPGQPYAVSLWVGTLKANGRDGTAFVQVSTGNASTNVYITTQAGQIAWFNEYLPFMATGAVMTVTLTTTNNDNNQFALVDNVGVYLLTTNAPTVLAIDLYPGLTITGNVGQLYRVDYTTAAGSTNWNPLTYFTLPTSPYLFYDPTPAHQTNRFYRAVQLSGP